MSKKSNVLVKQPCQIQKQQAHLTAGGGPSTTAPQHGTKTKATKWTTLRVKCLCLRSQMPMTLTGKRVGRERHLKEGGVQGPRSQGKNEVQMVLMSMVEPGQPSVRKYSTCQRSALQIR